MRVIISAGGTGGHIYPAVAMIQKIKDIEPNSEFLYIGTTDRMEKDLIPSMNIPYHGILMMGVNRKNPFKNIKVFRCFFKGIKDARSVIKKFNPDIVLGFGGYITAPVIYAAKKEGFKTLIHEQNAFPGVSNKFLIRYVDKVAVSLPDSISYFPKDKVVYTGNPRSEEIVKAKTATKKSLGLEESKKLVIIVMGSLGSMTVNEKLKSMLSSFANKPYQVLLVTGKNYYEEYRKINVPKNVRIVSYLNNLIEVMKSADLMVTRAGASTIAEVTAIGLPVIFVPSPYVTNHHQEKNANELVQCGAADMILEPDLTSEILLSKIDSLLNDKVKYQSMKKNSLALGVKDSATKLYKVIKEIVGDK